MHNLATKAVACVPTQRARLLFALWLVLAACWPALASQSYDFKIIAQTGQPLPGTGLTLASIKSECSINDIGTVAFIGVFPNGEGQGVFRQKSGQAIQFLTPNDVSSSKEFGSVWLNNSNQLATTLIMNGTYTVDQVRRYEANTVPGPVYEILERGGSARDLFGNPKYPFDNIFDNLSMNSAGNVAFSGQLPFTTFTALTNIVAGGKLAFSGFLNLRPAIDDSGRVAVRSGGQPNSPILLWNPGFTTSVPIATGAAGFTRMGQSPGITSDGRIIAFYGEDAQGPGIFVSIDTAGVRSLAAVARSSDGFGSFTPDSRVGVNSDGTSVNVVFIATLNGRVGVHYVRLILRDSISSVFVRNPPLPIMQAGDVVYDDANDDGQFQSGTEKVLAGLAQTFGLYAPISAVGQVVFWVQTDNGNQGIVTAKLPDCRGLITDGFRRQYEGAPSHFGLTDSCNTTNVGCALCTVANMLMSFGLPINPSTLNTRMKWVDGFDSDCKMLFGKIPDAVRDLADIQPISGWVSGSLDDYLDLHFCNRDERIILRLIENVNGVCPEIDGHGHCVSAHFVLVTGKNGDDWEVFDPGWNPDNITNVVSKAHFATLQSHISGFTALGKFRDFQVAEVRAFRIQGNRYAVRFRSHSPVELLAIDPLGRRIGNYGQATNDIIEIPESSYFRETPLTYDDADGVSSGDASGVRSIYIPKPVAGVYQLQVTGTGTGAYTLELETVLPGTNSQIITIAGVTSPGSVTNLTITVPAVPPLAVDDSAMSVGDAPVMINVLENDSSPLGNFVTNSLVVTHAPTNGIATVNTNTGVITYTPNSSPAGTNTDSFRYTVKDDLGTISNEGTVVVTNIVLSGGAAQLQAIPDYLVAQVTSGSVDHRYPRINNLGEVVYQSPAGGLQQVWKKPTGDPSMSSASQVTFPNASYGGATSPGIADDGSFVCFRVSTNGSYAPKDILKYPGPAAAQTNPQPAVVLASSGDPGAIGYYSVAGSEPSLTSDSKPVFSYANARNSLSGDNDFYNTYLLVGGQVVSPGNSWNGSHPDANDQSHFVFGNGSQIFLDNQFLTNGSTASVNDAPRDKPEVVYVNGTNLMSTLFGKLDAGPYSSVPISGSWVDVNASGVLVFEKLVNGYYQVFKAYPWEIRIVSRGGTNGLVGLPHKYDGDNIAEAYGGPEPVNDPRFASAIDWSVVSGPAGFTIDPSTGHINWIPTAPGNYTAVIRAHNWNLALGDVEDLQTIHIFVAQSVVQVVDAVDFRTPGTPDLPTMATNYATGGTPRIGVLADGASRLVLRVPLVGVETNSFPNLHFSIGGTNQLRDGLLRAISGSSWWSDVPATIANVNGTNFALCLYESPMDFDVASQPVSVRLFNGTNVIAPQPILLRRPPVVLVHDGWSGPDAWPVLMSSLFDAGMDVYLVDYAFTSGSFLTTNTTGIFLKANEAMALARQSGFAASRFDLVGHGAGGILARLHAQRYAAQDTNYRKGDVHKLITIGSPHQGSWLAATLLALRTNNPTAFASLRNAVLSGSEAGGYYPPIDLNAGLMDDLAPGSTVLMQLEATSVPSHAIAATVNALPPGDPISFIHYFLGLTNQGDGLVTANSAFGGIQTNAITVFTNIAHAFEPTDSNIVARVLALLQEPLSISNHFGYFPAAVAQTNLLVGVIATNIGTWLSLSGATNGQTFAPGQTVNLTAIASGGHTLQSAEFISSVGSTLITVAPFSFSFQIPTQAVGRVVIAAAGKDTNNGVAFASVALNVVPAFALQSLSVTPSPAVFSVKTDLALGVLGLYADGIQRNLTFASSGTKYKSGSPFNISVNSNGVLHPFVSSLVSPVTVSITNGTVWTNVQVTMTLTNLPPTAVIAANRSSGPAPFDVQFDGSGSVDANGDALNYLWDFGDGTTSTQPAPLLHRFWIPGGHVVTLTVTDPFGFVGYDRFIVTVEDRLVVDGVAIILTNWTAYGEVIVTNGALLTSPNGLSKGNVFVTASTNVFGGSNFLYSLSLRSNAVLTVPAQVALDLTASNMVVDASSRVDAVGKGYSGGYNGSGNGKGPGGANGFNGGCYGGIGGIGAGLTNGGAAYGSFSSPVDFGSGGGIGYYGFESGGAGGGLIRLTAQTLQCDGELAVDGVLGVGSGASGSGGSVNITSHVLTGNGIIHANGSGLVNGYNSGGGGGGRVAIAFDDMSGFAGRIEAKGGVANTNSCCVSVNGGAGTVYLKKNSDAYGTLIVDNGGTQTSGWSTPIPSLGILRLKSWIISGNARVFTSDGVRVANGSSTFFSSLISSNYLQVGGLLVSNTWVFGDVIEPIMSLSNGVPLLTVYCRPQKTYVVQASRNLTDWFTITTATPTNSRFDYLVTNLPAYDHLFFRPVMMDQYFTQLNLTIKPYESERAIELQRWRRQQHNFCPSFHRLEKLDINQHLRHRDQHFFHPRHQRTQLQQTFLPRHRTRKVRG